MISRTINATDSRDTAPCSLASTSRTASRAVRLGGCKGWGGSEAPGVARRARLTPGSPSPPIDPCMRFSRTRLADVLHRRHSACPVPRPEGSRRDDDSVEVDQPETVRGLAGNDPPAEPPVTLMPVGDKYRQPVDGVEGDLVEELGGVSVSEVARPAAQEPVEVLNDLLDGEQQPFTGGDLPNALTGVLHGLA